MDNYDKLYTKYRQASTNEEAKDFPAMEKVWTRLEDKLDAKVHKKKSKTWKKLAIAASVLLVFSLGYQIFKPTEIVNQENEVVETETNPVKTEKPQSIPEIATENQIVAEEPIVAVPKRIANPNIRQDADAMLKKQIGEQETVGYEPKSKVSVMSNSVIFSDSIRDDKFEMDEFSKSSSAKGKFKNRIFDAKSVQKSEIEDSQDVGSFAPRHNSAKSVQSKNQPLIVMDGKAVKDIKKVDPEDLESIVLLPDPLYIINGVEYSEESLFGKNPTSPYAPLSKQELESITVLQADEAVKTYGKKGENGVVVIITKKGKPASTK